MQLILTEERGDFDTIGAMLGAYLLHPDSILIQPEQFAVDAQVYVERFYFKFPFENASSFQDGTGNWLFPRLDGLLFGFDFLQSLQIARQLMEAQFPLDPFHASTILLGIYASMNHLQSFSAEQALDQVLPYLLSQGAEVEFVQEWLAVTPEQVPPDLPVLAAVPLAEAVSGKKKRAIWQTLLEQVLKDASVSCNDHLYLVGGVVRDLLMGNDPRDIDFVVAGNAIPLAQRMKKKFGGRVTTHQAFGTATWLLRDAWQSILQRYSAPAELDLAAAPEAVDLITARNEWYPKIAQLPVVRPGSIVLDLHRRDFSINSLAIRLDANPTELLDACGGRNDLRDGIIRVLHPLSFQDDPTRIFRAVRYEQRLGFRMDAQTESWLAESLHWIPSVSGDRLRHEINLMFLEEKASPCFHRMQVLGVLKALHPGLMWQDDWTAVMDSAVTRPITGSWNVASTVGNLMLRQFLGYAVWLARQPLKVVKAVCALLRFSHPQTQAFTLLCTMMTDIESLRTAPKSVLVRKLDSCKPETLYALDCLAQQDAEMHRRVLDYRDNLRDWQPGITGERLLALGIPPGKVYREVLSILQDAWLDERIHSTEEETTYLLELLRARGFNIND